MAFLELKKEIASYMGAPVDSATRYVPADLIFNGTDLLSIAINDARKTIERAYDLTWSQDDALLSISPTGGSIANATDVPSGTISVKKVTDVTLPISGGNYVPIELISNDTFLQRTRSQYGRQAFDATLTWEDVGISEENPVAIQQGQVISLLPADQFNFPIVAKLSIIKFLPDYSGDTDTDFIMQVGREALKWLAVVSLNRLMKQFGLRPLEGDVAEPMDLAKEALKSFIEWDMSLVGSKITPDDIAALTSAPPSKQQ